MFSKESLEQGRAWAGICCHTTHTISKFTGQFGVTPWNMIYLLACPAGGRVGYQKHKSTGSKAGWIYEELKAGALCGIIAR